jgi:hypothetical protein
MLNSPSTSPLTPGVALLGCALGVWFMARGVKVVIKRRAEVGPKGGSHLPIFGKDALNFGLALATFGLLLFVFGIFGFVKLFHLL